MSWLFTAFPQHISNLMEFFTDRNMAVPWVLHLCMEVGRHWDRIQPLICILRRKVTPLRTPMSMLLTEKTDGLKEELKSPSVSTLRSPSLNRDGGQRHHLAATYNAVLGALPSSLTFIHTWGHVSPRCHMKPELRGERSRVIHTWAHVTLTTHMMPSQGDELRLRWVLSTASLFLVIVSTNSGLNTWVSCTDPPN